MINETEFPILQVQVKPGKLSNTSMLHLNWTLINFTSSGLLIKLKFEHPEYVSSNFYPDTLEILVHGFYLFADKRGNFMQPEFEMNSKVIPRQVVEYVGLDIKTLTNTVGVAVVVLFASNFVITIFIAGPL